MFWFILIGVGILILFILYLAQFKKLKIPCVYLITGGPKTGKTLISIWLACFRYRVNLLKWNIFNYIILPIYNHFIRFLFRKKKLKNTLKPMLYSNIPLANIKVNPLTLDIIRRLVRIPNKSVVLIDEASLIASNMDYKDDLLNEEVSLFIKLFGHYSHGGSLIYNTQDMKDTHYGFKRCTSSMLWIHSKTKLPFFTIFKVRELISLNDDSVSTENNFTEDIEMSCLKLVVPNKYYYFYDCFCFSALTDDLPYQVNYDAKKRKNSRFNRIYLKTRKIISFKKFKTIKEEFICNTENKNNG